MHRELVGVSKNLKGREWEKWCKVCVQAKNNTSSKILKTHHRAERKYGLFIALIAAPLSQLNAQFLANSGCLFSPPSLTEHLSQQPISWLRVASDWMELFPSLGKLKDWYSRGTQWGEEILWQIKHVPWVFYRRPPNSPHQHLCYLESVTKPQNTSLSNLYLLKHSDVNQLWKKTSDLDAKRKWQINI